MESKDDGEMKVVISTNNCPPHLLMVHLLQDMHLVLLSSSVLIFSIDQLGV